MVPPTEVSNAETEINSDVLDDMIEGLAHPLPRRLLNSTYGSN